MLLEGKERSAGVLFLATTIEFFPGWGCARTDPDPRTAARDAATPIPKKRLLDTESLNTTSLHEESPRTGFVFSVL
jgi:hypothetical protein